MFCLVHCFGHGLQVSDLSPLEQAAHTVSQTSIPYDRWKTGGDPLAKLSFDDPRLADTSGGLLPSQVWVHTYQACSHAPALLQWLPVRIRPYL